MGSRGPHAHRSGGVRTVDGSGAAWGLARGGQVRDVRGPDLVELTAVESTVDQVVGAVCVEVDHGGHRGELPRADPGQALAAHRGRHRLAGDHLPVFTQIGQDARCAVHLIGGVVETLDLDVDRLTALLGRRGPRRTGCAPLVEARPGHLQQSSHPHDREVGLLRFDDPVHLYQFCSEAKKAASLSKTHGPNAIRRSLCVTVLTLCVHHRRAPRDYRTPNVLWRWRPTGRAIDLRHRSLRLRPQRADRYRQTRRTACSRYSGAYFLRFPDTGTSSPQDQQSRDQMSTIRGQPQHPAKDPALSPPVPKPHHARGLTHPDVVSSQLSLPSR